MATDSNQIEKDQLISKADILEWKMRAKIMAALFIILFL